MSANGCRSRSACRCSSFMRGEAEVQAPAWASDWYLQASAELVDLYPLTAEVRNNHWYWAGLAAVVAGTIAGNGERYDWGIAQLHAGIADIDADGFLPLELERGEMALRYTAFAASALVVMTAFEHANGRALPGDEQQDLQRLVRRVLTGLGDPREFERRAGRRAGKARSRRRAVVRLAGNLLQPDRRRRGGAVAQASRPMKLMWLGGDVTMAFGRRIAPGPIARSPLIVR